ncbi:MAG: hypothetical protein E7163_05395 [Firmicutes bacterium]|nr:hypothetical protein [Bacillota bacterium]
MDKTYGIVLTIIAGLFFLLGGLISLKTKDKDKLNRFSVSLAFIIMLNLIIVDLLPEIIESLENYKMISKIGIIILFIILGILLLKILDFFIPDHHHDHHDNEKNIEEHNSHRKHIGILTLFSLVLHNVIEGFAIFGLAINDLKAGLLICLSVALHNIPLGTHIFSSIDIKKNKLLVVILTLSSLFGGLLFLIIGDVSSLILSIILCITLGMIIYIAFLELLPEIINNKSKKETKLGLLIGIIIAILSIFV